MMDSLLTKEGDLVQLVGLTHKNFIFRLSPGNQLHTHRGILNHTDLIGIPWGSQVSSHLGRPFFLLQPSLADLIRIGLQVDLASICPILVAVGQAFLTGYDLTLSQMAVGCGAGSSHCIPHSPQCCGLLLRTVSQPFSAVVSQSP
jgi:hypothetical protein